MACRRGHEATEDKFNFDAVHGKMATEKEMSLFSEKPGAGH